MKLSAILFSISLLASGTLSALPPLPATRPPFESSEKESVRNTRFIPGKELCRFQGEAAQVICYKSGTPQLHFRSPDRRFGGIAIQIDGKDVKGTRREDGQNIIYDFPGSGTLSIALRPDGKVQFEARFPQAERKLQINFFLRGVEFGGTRFKIDEREFTLPPYVDKTLKADRMFSGGARAIRLCAGQPEKSFTVEPESGKTEFINVPAPARISRTQLFSSFSSFGSSRIFNSSFSAASFSLHSYPSASSRSFISLSDSSSARENASFISFSAARYFPYVSAVSSSSARSFEYFPYFSASEHTSAFESSSFKNSNLSLILSSLSIIFIYHSACFPVLPALKYDFHVSVHAEIVL